MHLTIAACLLRLMKLMAYWKNLGPRFKLMQNNGRDLMRDSLISEPLQTQHAEIGVKINENSENFHHRFLIIFAGRNCVGTGRHVFDFLGVATDVKYKKAWKHHALQEGTTNAAVALFRLDCPVINRIVCTQDISDGDLEQVGDLGLSAVLSLLTAETVELLV